MNVLVRNSVHVWLFLCLLFFRSYLDMAKVLVFRHLFWFVLAVVFITGATRISVFGLGYLLACFFFLLFGTQLLVKPCRTRLNLWDCLIIYNVAVIISKNMLSVSIRRRWRSLYDYPPLHAALTSWCNVFTSRCRCNSYTCSPPAEWWWWWQCCDDLCVSPDPGVCLCCGDAGWLLLGDSALQPGLHSQWIRWP